MSESETELIVGIDLGTTNSLVGVVDSGFPILLADESGRRLLPSAVSFPEGGEPLVGEPALRNRSLLPKTTITSVKRLMGRRPAEVENEDLSYEIRSGSDGFAEVSIQDQFFRPEEISALILKRLKATAEAALEEPVKKAVITVPAYFNDGQRNATKRAGELAGLEVVRILNEPTAAALAYGLDKLGEQSRVAVFDLGGGTFDISLLELREGVFEVVATNGDTRLGGDDVDRALLSLLTEKLSLSDLSGEQSATLLEMARRAKEALSTEETFTVQLPFFQGDQSLTCEVSRDELERAAQPILDRVRKPCLRALADAKIGDAAEQLDQVILVGGSTRMPLVRRMVAEIFGQEPNTTQHPDEAVALGAAIQAGVLCGRVRQVVLLDVTPLSLGIETYGGLMNVILPRNTTIPAKAGELFTNPVANQEGMSIRVLQGEREMARDNWELGYFTLAFEPGPKGSARVGVQFEIDENGILKVLARDTKTNQDTVLKIENSAVDVEDEQVEAMISESVEHAFSDMNERIWTEAKMKSEEMLAALDMARAALGEALPEEEKATVLSAEKAVREALNTEPPDAQKLKQANQQLDEATEPLAALLVEKAMAQALEAQMTAPSAES